MSQSKLTFNEIIEQLKPLFENVHDFAYENGPSISEDYEFQDSTFNTRWKEYHQLSKKRWDNKYKDSHSQIMDNLNTNYKDVSEKAWEFYKDETGYNLEWEEVAQKGGEGEGDEWYSVKYFPQHDIYIRVDGWYQSHNGTEFDGWGCCTEVRPKEVLVTVYN